MFQIAQSAMGFFALPEALQVVSPVLPDIGDLRDKCDTWVGGLGVATAFGGQFASHQNWQLLFNFVRRVAGAADQYEAARLGLLSVPDAKEMATTRYVRATIYFENCVSQTYQALMLISHFGKLGKLFERGDGSIFQRINLIYNRTKHVDKAIEAGQIPDNASLPVNLTDAALVAVDAELKYDELAGTISMLGDGVESILGSVFFGGGDNIGKRRHEVMAEDLTRASSDDW